jgi:hypothetical protein
MQMQKDAKHQAIWEQESQRLADRSEEWAYDAWLKGDEDRVATVNNILALRDTLAAKAMDAAAQAEVHARYEPVLADARREVEIWDIRHPEAVKRHTEESLCPQALPRNAYNTPYDTRRRSAEETLRNAG